MICEQFRFTPESTRLTALALQCYAPGLMVFCLAKVFVPVFYATQDTKTPVRYATISMVVNLAGNLALIVPLRHMGPPLATATVLIPIPMILAITTIMVVVPSMAPTSPAR